MNERERHERKWGLIGLALLIFGILALATTSGLRPIVPPPHGLTSTPRSPHWPKTRAEHLEREPACAICGERDYLEVHHVRSFHENPDLELDPDNLITLCGHGSRWDHHLWFGHLGNYQCSNPDVRKWAKAVKERK